MLSDTKRERIGRPDIFVDKMGEYVSVVEIQSTDWDKIKPKNVKKNFGSLRRKVWRYIDKYLVVDEVEVYSGMIYPTVPKTPGLKKLIKKYPKKWGRQVVWYDD